MGLRSLISFHVIIEPSESKTASAKTEFYVILGHHSFSHRPTRGSISSYNIARLISEVSEKVATQIAKIAVVNNPTLI